MIKTAEDLFKLNRSQIPDPNNPKSGDTYENVVNYGMFELTSRIVITEVNLNGVWYYVNGEYKGMPKNDFKFFIQSMPEIKPVVNSLMESSK